MQMKKDIRKSRNTRKRRVNIMISKMRKEREKKNNCIRRRKIRKDNKKKMKRSSNKNR